MGRAGSFRIHTCPPWEGEYGARMDRRELVPVGDGAEQALSLVLDAYGRSGVSLAECLDGDAGALSADDLQYFEARYFGRVPTYAAFMRALNQLPGEKRDEFNEAVAEIEAGRTRGQMRAMTEGTEFGRQEQVRFNMLGKLNAIYEKRIDRVDRRRRDRGEGAAQGVDMAARLIHALSDADLLKVKGRCEAIDAEYKEVAEGG